MTQLDSMIPKEPKLLIRRLSSHPKWSWGSRAIPMEGGRMGSLGSTRPRKSTLQEYEEIGNIRVLSGMTENTESFCDSLKGIMDGWSGC